MRYLKKLDLSPKNVYSEYMIAFGRVFLILLMLLFSFQLVSSPTPFIFIDYFNLLIHEAGHFISWPFGEFLDTLAGSAFQVFIPSLFLFYFLRRKEYFSVFTVLFWVADNIINVAVYMKDSIPMNLPLLGGDNVFHDWNYLFTALHLLPASYFIGQGFFVLGEVLLIISILALIYITVKDLGKSN